ncbi:hypothetical protein HYV70_00915 [Candidatus Uhrbacteria bacterium]|nr:hypothetical protein [Candidatus Uhrbacteria bacterium]
MQQNLPKSWIFVFLVVTTLVIVILLIGPEKQISKQKQVEQSQQTTEPSRSTTFESMLEAADNAIYVENQKTGASSVQIGFVVLSRPGYVVVFNDQQGIPGSVIGQSDLLSSGGEHFAIPVSNPLQEGEVYYAILYHDDGDERLRLEKDVQVTDSQNSVILMNFIASQEAEPEQGAIAP